MTQNKKKVLGMMGWKMIIKTEKNTTILICNICLNVSKEFIMHKIVIKRKYIEKQVFINKYHIMYELLTCKYYNKRLHKVKCNFLDIITTAFELNTTIKSFLFAFSLVL